MITNAIVLIVIGWSRLVIGGQGSGNRPPYTLLYI